MTPSSRQDAWVPILRSTLIAGLLAGGIAVLAAGCGSKASVELCPVSGEKLGSMGEPYSVEHEGKQIRLCCEGCKDDFAKDPSKYAAKVAN